MLANDDSNSRLQHYHTYKGYIMSSYEEVVRKAAALLSSEVVAPEKEGGKSSLVFNVEGVNALYGTKGHKTLLPFEISKRSMTQLFSKIAIASGLDVNEDSLSSADRLLCLASVKDSKLVDFTEKSIPTITNVLMQTPNDVEREDLANSFRGILAVISNTIERNDSNPSLADPLSDVKRRFVKSAKYLALMTPGKDASAYVMESIDTDIANLTALRAKAATVSQSDYTSFLAEKFAKNGLDEDGFVMLRAKKAVATV